jgi:GntR family transcriptional regulator
MSDRSTTTTKTVAADELGFRPLYRQVRQRLMQRLSDGTWGPGQMLPSEGQIAVEFGVSQGTVRKALDEMAAEHILVRRQGRGTFVAEHNEQRILFQYFKIVPDEGERQFPQSRVLSVKSGTASGAERRALEIAAGSAVMRIHRVRSMGGVACISEYISLPAAIFPNLVSGEVPNNLYELYARQYGVTISQATERIKAIGLGAKDSSLLGLERGTPVLHIDRVARALDGTRVEWRVSICRSDCMHYLSDLR